MVLFSVLRQASLLLLLDTALLALLAQLAPPVANWGLAATWLEAGVRLVAFLVATWLLGPPGGPVVASVLGVLPAVFFTLRSLLASVATGGPRVVATGSPGLVATGGPGLLATGSPVWVALTHVVATMVVLLRATWGAGEKVTTKVATRGAQRLLGLVAAEWPVLSGAFTCLVLAVLGEAAAPLCTGKVLDAIRVGDAATTSALGLVLTTHLASSFFAGCRGGLFTLAKSRLELHTRSRLFSHLVRQDLTFFQETPTAELASRLAGDVAMLGEAVALNANVAMRNLVLALGVGGFMVGISPGLAVLALLEVPLGVAARRVYDARCRVLQRALLDATAATTAVVQEAISSIETVRTFAGEEEEEQRHSQAVAKMLELKNQMDTEEAIFTLVQRVLQLAMQVLVLCRGHQELREGSVTTGSLVTFLLYQAQVGHYVQSLVSSHGNLMNQVSGGHKVWEYLDREARGDAGGTWMPATLQGHVIFQGVSFAYPTRPENLVLQDVSFELLPGEVTALAGLNGSGKSTCAALLEHFYEPRAGNVLLDGVPLRDYQHQYLHRQVAMVGQEPVLFSGTIRDNITLGLENVPEDEVRAAAATASALTFIAALEKGFDTEVGEKGGRLSAGEKQRVAIARALVRRPAVLILDEATSALDGEGEEVLLRSRGVCTVLLITHHPRLLEVADHVVVLDRGTVVETGSPAELRRRGGIYGRLLQRGQGGGEEEPRRSSGEKVGGPRRGGDGTGGGEE